MLLFILLMVLLMMIVDLVVIVVVMGHSKYPLQYLHFAMAWVDVFNH
jgi:hypothetical protein